MSRGSVQRFLGSRRDLSLCSERHFGIAPGSRERRAFDILIDVSDAPVSSAATSEQMKPVAAALRSCGARRIAWVTGIAINRMQLRRLMGQRPISAFFLPATRRSSGSMTGLPRTNHSIVKA